MPTRLVVRNFRSLFAPLASVLLVLCLVGGSAVYKDGPAPGHTGGFGEPTCHRCHSDSPTDDDRLVFGLTGVPEMYAPGRVYNLAVAVAHPEMRSGGFQLASRFGEGEMVGTQAGSLIPFRDGTRVVSDSAKVAYLSHSEPASGDSVTWQIRWRSPTVRVSVVFNLAVNAANGDDSEFGDWTASNSLRSMPAGRIEAGTSKSKLP